LAEEEILLKQSYLNIGQSVLLAIGLAIFLIVVRERKELKSWFFAYCALEVGFIFSNVNYLTGIETYSVMSSVFYLLSAILICIAGKKIDLIINKIQRSTSSMEGISASTEEQTASMEEIAATANRLGNIAEKLKEDLSS